MFSAATKIGNTCTYQPSTIPTTNVTFRPLTQPDGNKQYVALLETEEELILSDEDTILPEEEEREAPHEKLYHNRDIYASTSSPSSAKYPDPFSLGNDPIKTFYIGSVTVVGLYILYRILTKTRA